MIDRYERLMTAQTNWELDRPAMSQNNADLLILWSLLYGEVIETGDEVQEALIKADNGVLDVVTVDLIAKELDDVLLFVIQMYSIIGVDMYDSVMDKIAYNQTRYWSKDFQQGADYEQSRLLSKQRVKDTNWKAEYYGY